MKKFILLILAIIIAGGGYYYFFVSNNTEVATTSYEYIKIEKGNIKKTVSATGKIIPTSTLTLSSEISGKIVEINKDFNEQIGKGEVLAIFDQNPFTLSVKESQTSVDISKSKLKQKQASLEKAKSELNNSPIPVNAFSFIFAIGCQKYSKTVLFPARTSIEATMPGKISTEDPSSSKSSVSMETSTL